MPLILEIVTPEARVYSETVDTVVIPTVEGEVGILRGTSRSSTQMGAGELRATRGNVTQYLIVGGGFAQVTGEKVSILADSAIEEEKIDVNAVENAMKRARMLSRARKGLIPRRSNGSKDWSGSPSPSSGYVVGGGKDPGRSLRLGRKWAFYGHFLLFYGQKQAILAINDAMGRSPG